MTIRYFYMIKSKTPSQIVIDGFTWQWKKFKQRLSEDLHQEFDELTKHAREHPHPDPEGIPFQQIVMSILIEQEKEINRLRTKLSPYLRKKCPRCHTEGNKEDFNGRLCSYCRKNLFFPLPKPDKPD